MKQELLEFIKRNNITPFGLEKNNYRSESFSVFKTRESREIHNKVINWLSSDFVFKSTKRLWDFFVFKNDYDEIKKRQDFFKSIKVNDCSYLKLLLPPKKTWKPKYDVIVVTEDESTFSKLKEIGCPIKIIFSESDISELEKYDVVQVIDCDDFAHILERLPNTIFFDSFESVYLERYLEILSSWRENVRILRNAQTSPEIKEYIEKLEPFFNLIDGTKGPKITEEELENALEKINEKIYQRMKDLTITGEGLLKILSQGKVPKEILDIIKEEIKNSGYDESLFNLQIPLTLDYDELYAQIKRNSITESGDFSITLKKNSKQIRDIPNIINELSALIILEDFSQNIAKKISNCTNFPLLSQDLVMENSKNIFLINPQPISFKLDYYNRCSILTGANSGGKTTLIEHIIQLISLFYLGLPVSGSVKIPIFDQVYYFAKNKGSASRGAFETLLNQMSGIVPGKSTLILADEIEALTEPGVAGKIISATCDYFIKKGCFIVMATHLGQAISKDLPAGARIDGIEAKGLDENFNLIVDHNPVIGKLASSTPELIVEKMANLSKNDYFQHINKKLKGYL